MKIVAIIPARGGSKRLEKKNIYPIWGKPLLHWAVQACKNSKHQIIPWVSTEDEEVAEVARQCGANVVMRDPSLASCYQGCGSRDKRLRRRTRRLYFSTG